MSSCQDQISMLGCAFSRRAPLFPRHKVRERGSCACSQGFSRRCELTSDTSSTLQFVPAGLVGAETI